MGTVRRIMITGASGFIGRATVQEALDRGLEVVAVVRNTVPDEWQNEQRIAIMRCDLSDPSEAERLADAMQVDAVVHAAAHLGSDARSQKRDSISATETLLRAMTLSGQKRLVLVSSIAVYDTSKMKARGVVTERSPVENIDDPRDSYVAGKLAQEILCQRAAERRGLSLCILRPGAVFGPDRTWNAHLGVGLGPVLLLFGGSGGELPLVHVSTCARVLVAAAKNEAEGVFNVLDSDRPKRRQFLMAHKRSGWPRFVFAINWRLLLLSGLVVRQLPGRTPGLFQSRIIKARMMPLFYPNDAMQAAFGVSDTGSFETLMAASLKGARG